MTIQEGEFAAHKEPNIRTTSEWDSSVVQLWETFNFSAEQFEGQTVLDVGAGSKLRGIYFQGINYIALEPLADRFLKELGWCNLKLANSVISRPAAEYVEELTDSVDFIFSINFLDHCYNFQDIIYNLRGYLNDSGTALLSFDEHAAPDEKHPIKLTKEICDKIFEATGFKIDKFEYTDSYHRSISDRALTYWVSKIPDSKLGSEFSTHLEKRKELQRRVAELAPWPTSIYLGEGVWTAPGVNMIKTNWYVSNIEKELGTLKGKRVLDVGSNTGYVALEAGLRGAEVVSIEPHQVNNERCKFVYETYCLLDTKIALTKTRMEDLNVEDHGRFDAIFFLGTIYHTEKPWEVLKNMAGMTDVIMVESRLAAHDAINENIGRYSFEKLVESGANHFPLHRVDTGVIRKPTRYTLFEMIRQSGFNQVTQLMPVEGLTPKYQAEECVTFIGRSERYAPLSLEENRDDSILFASNLATVEENTDQTWDYLESNNQKILDALSNSDSIESTPSSLATSQDDIEGLNRRNLKLEESRKKCEEKT